MNQDLATWVTDVRNIEANLKIVMWNNTKVPVKNLMCPICNSESDLDALRRQNLIDPECREERTQELIHRMHGWNNCALAIMDNIVYHQTCLEKKYKKRFAKLVEKGEILCESNPSNTSNTSN